MFERLYFYEITVKYSYKIMQSTTGTNFFTAAFGFAHAKQNLVKFKLYNWLAQAVNNISDSAMSNSSKSIKFAHL